MSKRLDLDIKILKRLYCEEDCTLREIGEKLGGISHNVIRHHLMDAGIPMRSPRESQLCARRHGRNPLQGLVGENHPAWKGGKKHIEGYWLIRYPHDYPFPKNKCGYRFEHIIVWELTHNRPLPKGWNVHHLNGIRNDNRPENLMALTAKGHTRKEMGVILKKRILQLETQVKVLEQALKDNQLIFMGN